MLVGVGRVEAEVMPKRFTELLVEVLCYFLKILEVEAVLAAVANSKYVIYKVFYAQLQLLQEVICKTTKSTGARSRK